MGRIVGLTFPPAPPKKERGKKSQNEGNAEEGKKENAPETE